MKIKIIKEKGIYKLNIELMTKEAAI